MPHQDQAPGKQLFNSASEFYSWYMSVDNALSQTNVFRALSELMRIALLSSEGGNFLSSTDESHVIQNLSKIKEELCDGNLKKESTFSKIRSLVEHVISSNPKARLISYATEIEYKFCILPPPSTEAEQLQSYLKHLLNFVNPSLLEIQAYAISQIMSKLLDNPKLHQNLGLILEKEINQVVKTTTMINLKDQ